MKRTIKITEKDLNRLVKRVIKEGLDVPITIEQIKQELAKNMKTITTWDNKKMNLATGTITLMDGELYFGDVTGRGVYKKITV